MSHPPQEGETILKKLNPGQKDPVKAAFVMPDSKDKHRKICDLMLEAEYLTSLWYTLKQEADRLEDAGFCWY